RVRPARAGRGLARGPSLRRRAGGGPMTTRRHAVPAGEFTYEPSQRWVRGVAGDVTVIDSKRPVLVWEPGRAVPLYAFPRQDVRTDVLVESAVPGTRPGAGTWYDLAVDGTSRA